MAAFHLLLSCTQPTSIPCSFRSFSTHLAQVFFGLPLPTVPVISYYIALHGMSFSYIRMTCPYHLNLLMDMMLDSGLSCSCNNASLYPFLVTILSIFLSCWISRSLMSSVIAQVSTAYNITDRTQLSYTTFFVVPLRLGSTALFWWRRMLPMLIFLLTQLQHWGLSLGRRHHQGMWTCWIFQFQWCCWLGCLYLVVVSK